MMFDFVLNFFVGSLFFGLYSLGLVAFCYICGRWTDVGRVESRLLGYIWPFSSVILILYYTCFKFLLDGGEYVYDRGREQKNIMKEERKFYG